MCWPRSMPIIFRSTDRAVSLSAMVLMPRVPHCASGGLRQPRALHEPLADAIRNHVLGWQAIFATTSQRFPAWSVTGRTDDTPDHMLAPGSGKGKTERFIGLCASDDFIWNSTVAQSCLLPVFSGSQGETNGTPSERLPRAGCTQDGNARVQRVHTRSWVSSMSWIAWRKAVRRVPFHRMCKSQGSAIAGEAIQTPRRALRGSCHWPEICRRING